MSSPEQEGQPGQWQLPYTGAEQTHCSLTFVESTSGQPVPDRPLHLPKKANTPHPAPNSLRQPTLRRPYRLLLPKPQKSGAAPVNSYADAILDPCRPTFPDSSWDPNAPLAFVVPELLNDWHASRCLKKPWPRFLLEEISNPASDAVTKELRKIGPGKENGMVQRSGDITSGDKDESHLLSCDVTNENSSSPHSYLDRQHGNSATGAHHLIARSLYGHLPEPLQAPAAIVPSTPFPNTSPPRKRSAPIELEFLGENGSNKRRRADEDKTVGPAPARVYRAILPRTPIPKTPRADRPSPLIDLMPRGEDGTRKRPHVNEKEAVEPAAESAREDLTEQIIQPGIQRSNASLVERVGRKAAGQAKEPVIEHANEQEKAEEADTSALPIPFPDNSVASQASVPPTSKPKKRSAPVDSGHGREIDPGKRLRISDEQQLQGRPLSDTVGDEKSTPTDFGDSREVEPSKRLCNNANEQQQQQENSLPEISGSKQISEKPSKCACPSEDRQAPTSTVMPMAGYPTPRASFSTESPASFDFDAAGFGVPGASPMETPQPAAEFNTFAGDDLGLGTGGLKGSKQHSSAPLTQITTVFVAGDEDKDEDEDEVIASTTPPAGITFKQPERSFPPQATKPASLHPTSYMAEYSGPAFTNGNPILFSTEAPQASPYSSPYLAYPRGTISPYPDGNPIIASTGEPPAPYGIPNIATMPRPSPSRPSPAPIIDTAGPQSRNRKPAANKPKKRRGYDENGLPDLPKLTPSPTSKPKRTQRKKETNRESPKG